MTEDSLQDREAADPGAAISRYEDRDRPALLEFRQDHYGRGTERADPAYVDWQFRQAPQAGALGAPLHVARQGGRIVGALGMVRTSLVVDGQPWPAVWVLDFAGRKELRRSGIGEALGRASRAERATRLVMEAATPTRGILRRAEYHALGDVPLFVRPIDPATLLRARGVPSALASLSSAVLPPLAALDALALRAARREQVELVETAAFDERADSLFAALSHVYPVLCRRDRAWLEWRFQRYPEEGRYRLHWLFRKAEAVGYAVLRSGTHHGARSGVLVDYLCRPGLVPALLTRCLERFRASGAAVACCLHLNPFAAAAFRALGFFRRSSGWPFLIRPESDAVPAAVRDPRKWFLTAGDANVDRDREDGVPTPARPGAT